MIQLLQYISKYTLLLNPVHEFVLFNIPFSSKTLDKSPIIIFSKFQLHYPLDRGALNIGLRISLASGG